MQWFKNLNARPRLMLGFGILVLLIAGMSWLAISKLATANESIADMYQGDMAGVEYADAMNIDRFNLGRAVRDAMLNMQDAQISAADLKTTDAALQDFHNQLDAASQVFVDDQEKPVIAALRSATPPWEKTVADLEDRIRARDEDGAKAALAATVEPGNVVSAALAKAREIEHGNAKNSFEANNAEYKSTRVVMLVVTAVAVLLGVILAFVIARSFSLPLGEAVSTLEKVAEGDLTVSLDLHTKDEVGRMAAALNNAVEKLRSTLEEVTQGAMHAGAASQQLASASQAIASGAQEQAASLEETSASLEEITATVRQSADNARQASQLASGSRDAAEQGQEVVSNAVTAMAEINAASAKIADIIGTIDEIAFQTNLLAVNAAVEAARAGEEGRGFAVVAAEVRSLAQRSAEAAKQIKALIQDSLRKVEKGTELVNKSGETLHGIVSSVKRVTDIVGEIAAAAGEQSTGIEQVNTAMTQMDQVTQSNSAQTEELSSTAESLSDQAAGLMELVKTFTLSKDNKSRSTLSAPRSHAVPVPVKKAVGGLVRSVAAKAASRKSAPTASVRPSGPALEPAMAAAHAGASQDDASFEEF